MSVSSSSSLSMSVSSSCSVSFAGSERRVAVQPGHSARRGKGFSSNEDDIRDRGRDRHRGRGRGRGRDRKTRPELRVSSPESRGPSPEQRPEESPFAGGLLVRPLHDAGTRRLRRIPTGIGSGPIGGSGSGSCGQPVDSTGDGGLDLCGAPGSDLGTGDPGPNSSPVAADRSSVRPRIGPQAICRIHLGGSGFSPQSPARSTTT